MFGVFSVNGEVVFVTLVLPDRICTEVDFNLCLPIKTSISSYAGESMLPESRLSKPLLVVWLYLLI